MSVCTSRFDETLAVNAAITLERPLLVKGEPGTGKTMLAEQLAESFGATSSALGAIIRNSTNGLLCRVATK